MIKRLCKAAKECGIDCKHGKIHEQDIDCFIRCCDFDSKFVRCDSVDNVVG